MKIGLSIVFIFLLSINVAAESDLVIPYKQSDRERLIKLAIEFSEFRIGEFSSLKSEFKNAKESTDKSFELIRDDLRFQIQYIDKQNDQLRTLLYFVIGIIVSLAGAIIGYLAYQGKPEAAEYKKKELTALQNTVKKLEQKLDDLAAQQPKHSKIAK